MKKTKRILTLILSVILLILAQFNSFAYDGTGKSQGIDKIEVLTSIMVS